MCDEFTLIKDAVVTIAAGVGAYVAWQGLDTWKAQLKGKTEYDLARRLLVNIYKYRDAIGGVRNPAIWPSEEPRPPEDQAEDMTFDQIRYYGISGAYQTRWDNVLESRVSLNAELMEAEAIWGTELKELFAPLFQLENDLYHCVRGYLTQLNPDTPDAVREAFANANTDILYRSPQGRDDEFKDNLDQSIETIETYIKPKLGHSN